LKESLSLKAFGLKILGQVNPISIIFKAFNLLNISITAPSREPLIKEDPLELIIILQITMLSLDIKNT